MLIAKTCSCIGRVKAVMLFVFCFLVISCEKEDDYLSLSVDELVAPVAGVETSFTIHSNSSWSLVVADSWVKVDQVSGYGDATVTVTIDPNLSQSDRNITLPVSSGTMQKNISITQSSTELSLNSREMIFDALGTAKEVAVTANTDWSLSFSDGDTWCDADVLSGKGNGVVTLTPKPYSTREIREGRIIFKAMNIEDTIHIRQEIHNEPPSTPIVLTPANGNQNERIPLHFSWKASTDADGDSIRYFILLSKDNANWNDTIATTTDTGISLFSSEIDKHVPYYWKVMASDPFGGTSESEAFQFTAIESAYYDGEVITYQTYSAPDAARGVNLVVVGDGFIDEDYLENGAFDEAADKAIEAFFNVEPYPTYRDYFTVYKVAAYSKERGATVLSDFLLSPQPKQTKNTVFNSVLDGGASTGITCNEETVFAYALKIPQITKDELRNTTIIVIVNLDVYAGTTTMYLDGRSIALCAMGKDTFEAVVNHEAGGHGFAKLMDEYIYYSEQSLPNSSKQEIEKYRQGNAWSFGANLSLTNDRDSVHWNNFFGRNGYEMVGLYEGGRLYGKGVWRPEENSCMNNNVPYYNAPSREAMVRRIMAINNIPFNYASFYAKDKIEPVAQALRSVAPKTTNWVPLAPPKLK